VICTALDGESYRDVCLREGAHAFVTKLQPWPEVSEALASALATIPERRPPPVIRPPRGLGHALGGERRHHDHGPKVRWMLRSRIPRREIVEKLGVSMKTVEYHATALRRLEAQAVEDGVGGRSERATTEGEGRETAPRNSG
jgi:hypothetical protein